MRSRQDDLPLIESQLAGELARVCFLVDQLTIARIARIADKKWAMVARGRTSIFLRELCQFVARAEPGGFALVLVPKEEKPDQWPSLDL